MRLGKTNPNEILALKSKFKKLDKDLQGELSANDLKMSGSFF